MAKEGLSSSLFSIKELSEKIKDGDITPVDLVEKLSKQDQNIKSRT